MGELQRIKLSIEELYRDKGYRFAQASYEVEDVGLHEKRVAFTFDEGDRVRIADVDFEGNEVFGDARLRWAMKKTKESGLLTRLLKKDIYNPGRSRRTSTGCATSTAAPATRTWSGRAPRRGQAGEPQRPPGRAETAHDADPPHRGGERWRFGEVTLEGNTTYTDQALLRAFQHRPGAWLRAKVVDDGVKAVADLYHNTGYIFARVEPELVEKADRVADVVVHVQEGEQYKVGRIEIAGNERTRDKVLRRELRLSEGGVMNATALRNSVLKINQLGYFKLDEEDPVEIDTDTEKKTVDLLFRARRRGAPSSSSAAAGASPTACSASSASAPGTSSGAASSSAPRSRRATAGTRWISRTWCPGSSTGRRASGSTSTTKPTSMADSRTWPISRAIGKARRSPTGAISGSSSRRACAMSAHATTPGTTSCWMATSPRARPKSTTPPCRRPMSSTAATTPSSRAAARGWP